MKYLQLLASGLLLMGLLGGTAAGCGQAQEPVCGGIEDSSQKNAPKEIKSDTLTSLRLHFLYNGIELGDRDSFPLGWYWLSAERTADGAHLALECDRLHAVPRLRFEQDLGASVLDELQAIIREHDLAALNGHSKRNSALGTNLDFRAGYDSGESISIYAEGGCSTLPYGWCGTRVFIEFFVQKLGLQAKLIAPLYYIDYSISDSRHGLTRRLSLEVDGSMDSRAIYKLSIYPAGGYGEPQVQEKYITREKMEELGQLLKKYDLQAWEKLPDIDSNEQEFEMESFSCGFEDSEPVSIDNRQALPPEGAQAFREVRAFLEALAGDD